MNKKEKPIGIVCWNLLYDEGNYFDVGPQRARIEAQIKTLTDLPVPLDVVGLVEVERDQDDGVLGKKIAHSLVQHSGYWFKSPRKNEYLGFFGHLLDKSKTIRPLNELKLVTAESQSIKIGLVHHQFNLKTDRFRQQQILDTLAEFKDDSKAVIMGDFNSASWQRSRKLLKAAGFQSVFEELGFKRKPTIIAPGYSKNLPLMYRLGAKVGQFAPDDIYVRGVNVLEAGLFEGDSDHRGVWALVS